VDLDRVADLLAQGAAQLRGDGKLVRPIPEREERTGGRHAVERASQLNRPRVPKTAADPSMSR
jgi:hypothetical protein